MSKGDDEQVQEIKRAASRVMEIPVALVKASKTSLRDAQKATEEYQSLCKSIKARGVLNPIVVREDRDNDTGEVYYLLIDGLQRLSSSQDCGLEVIPANVVDMNEVEMMEAQLITNFQRVTTKPAEYAKHLTRILSLQPTLTKNALADKLCVSTAFIEGRLKLTKLHEDIQVKVDEGQIPLLNAIALSDLPIERQAEYMDAAMTEETKVFGPKMKAVKKEIKDAKNQGRKEKKEFEPIAFCLKVAAIKEEAFDTEFAVGRTKCATDEELAGWQKAFLHILNIDEEGKAKQIADNEAREAKRKADAEQRKAEREEQKAKKAAAAANDVEEKLAEVG